MSDMQLKGSTGFLGKETSINVRAVKDGVSTEKVKAAIQDNNNDEVVVKGQSGTSYVVYADELSVANGPLPKPGTKVSLPFLPGEDGKQPATVQLVDDEFNEDYNFLGGGLVGELLNNKGGKSGDDAQIRAISQAVRSGELPDTSQEKVTQKELKWAVDLENLVNNGYSPDPKEVAAYTKIYEKYQASQASEPSSKIETKSPSRTSTTATPEEKEWAKALKNKIETEGYKPNQQELLVYQQITQKP